VGGFKFQVPSASSFLVNSVFQNSSRWRGSHAVGPGRMDNSAGPRGWAQRRGCRRLRASEQRQRSIAALKRSAAALDLAVTPTPVPA